VSAPAFAPTALAPTEQAAIPTRPFLPLYAEEVLPAIQTGGRVYAFIEPRDGGQGWITRLASIEHVERHMLGDPEHAPATFAWVNDTSVLDMIRETQPAPCGCWLNDEHRGHWSACADLTNTDLTNTEQES